MLELARRGLADIGAALKLRSVWWELAREDVVDSHRRTMLGPVWPLLNYLLFVGTLILILGAGAGAVNFPAYVAAGMLVWQYINDVMSMSATLFSREAGFIQGTVLPISVYVLRQTMVIAIRSFYALVGAIAVVLYSGIELTPALLSVVPAMLLLLLTAPAVAVLFGLAGTFSRDFQFIISNALRLLFFITPIFWTLEGIGGWQGLFYHWNPLTHYIDIVRQPVVEGVVPVNSWIITLLASGLLSAAALLLLGKFRRQIVFHI